MSSHVVEVRHGVAGCVGDGEGGSVDGSALHEHIVAEVGVRDVVGGECQFFWSHSFLA